VKVKDVTNREGKELRKRKKKRTSRRGIKERGIVGFGVK